MRKGIFIFMVFSLVSFSKSSEIIILKLGETFSSCDKKYRDHLDEIKDERKKMNEIYNKLIQKFDKNNKLKQDLINSQKIWIKNLSESKNYTEDVIFHDLCSREKAQTIREINLIQQRILELTNEYKKYLD
ncbi:hypothetical protein [Leptotrichia wadei]|uniref:Lysozyme inhibitor LprI N-terminal domain-containing protein n=1 Tax=Leptotrichia wadei TaxID=157687 RepID=A0A510KDR2_9FUSO|nr:hypothetical protein [Leptotrichia wadei]BBM49327.1 hypothetical protein JMUB3934_0622 [Leptotrichia wadei]